MITLRKSTDRRYVRSGSRELWMTFDPENAADPYRHGYRALDALNEVRLRPGTDLKLPGEPHQETFTYVREGRLAGRMGRRKDDLLGPGTCQLGITRLRKPLSFADGRPPLAAQMFIGSMSHDQEPSARSRECRYYPFSDRRGHLRLIASRDGSDSSLRLLEDVRIYSALLDPGHHVVHELRSGRGAWLHVVAGKVRLADQTLEAGDGAALDDEPGISFTAKEVSEVLLFDLA